VARNRCGSGARPLERVNLVRRAMLAIRHKVCLSAASRGRAGGSVKPIGRIGGIGEQFAGRFLKQFL